MNRITLSRIQTTPESTIGILDVFGTQVYTLEDTEREHKVWGETRIPEGVYRLDLRREGGMTKRYLARYPEMHQGMIWLRQVPFFEWIYIHPGNTAADTNGCILVGMAADKNILYRSREAYELIYPVIVDAIRNEGCEIEVSTFIPGG